MLWRLERNCWLLPECPAGLDVCKIVVLCADVETSKLDSCGPDPLHPRSVRSPLSLRCSQRKRQSCTVWLSVHLASSWTKQDCAPRALTSAAERDADKSRSISPDLIESPANVGRGVLREKPEVAVGALVVLTS